MAAGMFGSGMLGSGLVGAGVLGAGMLGSGVDFVAGIDFICAALTLAYIGRLLFQALPMYDAIGASCSVAKVSLRGQQVARRIR